MTNGSFGHGQAEAGTQQPGSTTSSDVTLAWAKEVMDAGSLRWHEEGLRSGCGLTHALTLTWKKEVPAAGLLACSLITPRGRKK